MLRLTVLALILANAAYFAWAQGLLRPWGLGPSQPPEPQRLVQQIRPEALRVIRTDEVAAPPAEAAPGDLTTPAAPASSLKPASQPPAAAGP